MATSALHTEPNLSELIEAADREGPQIVRREGVERAVLVSMQEWKCLREAQRMLENPLLSPLGPHFDLELPPRGSFRLRDTNLFEDE